MILCYKIVHLPHGRAVIGRTKGPPHTLHGAVLAPAPVAELTGPPPEPPEEGPATATATGAGFGVGRHTPAVVVPVGGP